MTNLDIITTAAIESGIYTKEEAMQLLEAGFGLPLYTFAEWKKAGYKVKRGEHAKLVCKIWQKRTGKAKEEEAEQDKAGKPNDFFLKTAHFFTAEQVEKIKED